MRRIFLFVLAISLICGVANAAGIPTAADPLNAPEVWTMEVYNNSGVALTSGNVVVWDCNSDTADTSYAYRTMWVTRTTTADDIMVAGVVVDDSIAITGVGTIAIWGPVYVLMQDSHNTATAAEDLVGTSDNQAGTAEDFTGTGADNGSLGVALHTGPLAASLGGYDGRDANDYVMVPVFVDIVRFSDN